MCAYGIKNKMKFNPNASVKSNLSALTSFEADPNEYLYSGQKTNLSLGESVVFAIVALDEENSIHYKCVNAAKNWRDNKENCVKTGHFDVILPDDLDIARTILDDEGVPLSNLQTKNFMRVPIMYICKLSSQGKVIDFDPQLKYITLKPGVLSQLKKMSEDKVDGSDFDAIPDYLVRLSLVEPKNKSFKHDYTLSMHRGEIMEGKKSIFPANYREEDFFAMLDKIDAVDYFTENIDAFLEAMHENFAKISDPDLIRNNFGKMEVGESKSNAIAEKPRLGSDRRKTVEPEEEENDGVDVEEATREIEEAQPATRTSRFANLSKK